MAGAQDVQLVAVGAVTINGVKLVPGSAPGWPPMPLFAVLGNSFGGDGKTTFALPDLRAVTPNGLTYMICTQGVFPHS